MTKLEKGLIIFVAFLLAVVGFALYERHTGAESCVNTDTSKANQQIVQQAATHADQTIEVAKEATDYDKALTQPIDVRVPDVRVCPAAVAPDPGPVRAAAGAAGASHDTADRGAADPRGAVQTNPFGPGLYQIGHDADAQIQALQAYINNVCAKVKP